MKTYNTGGAIISWRYALAILCTYPALLAAEAEKKQIQPVSYHHVLNWALGLVIVLSVFFACVWIMRKTGSFVITSKASMKVISGVSLGVREKLVLVQVGNKQLVLAVTPGKIDKLLVLEGDEQLQQDDMEKPSESEFSQQLSMLLKRPVNE